MEKVHLIGWALLICLIGTSATTAIVNSIAEAQNTLGTRPALEEIGCKVYSIEKIATTQEEITGNDWIVSFAEEYLIDGSETRDGIRTVAIRNNTEEAVKEATEPICDADWITIQEENGAIDTVKITTLAKDNPVLNQVYSAASKTWKSLATGQIEP